MVSTMAKFCLLMKGRGFRIFDPPDCWINLGYVVAEFEDLMRLNFFSFSHYFAGVVHIS